MTMLFGVETVCGRAEGSQASLGTHGGEREGKRGALLRTRPVTEKGDGETSRPPPSLLPPPPPLQACPLKIDKVASCVAPPALTPLWLTLSVRVAIRSRPFAAAAAAAGGGGGGCHTTFSNTIEL